MLAAPSAGSNDNMLQDAVTAATNRSLVRPNDHVVCVMSIKDSLVVKVVTMDGIGARCMRHSNSAQGVNHTAVKHSQNIYMCTLNLGTINACCHSRPRLCCLLLFQGTLSCELQFDCAMGKDVDMFFWRCAENSHADKVVACAGSEVDLSKIDNITKSGAVLAPEIELDSSPIPSRVTAPAHA